MEISTKITKSRGSWRDVSMFNNAYCSHGGLGFGSHQPYGGSQHPATVKRPVFSKLNPQSITAVTNVSKLH